VEAQPALVPLLRQSGLKHVVAYDTELPAFDVHVLLLSLPRLFRTRLDNIPANVPYLSASLQLISKWGQKLTAYPGFKVGVNWQGDTGYTYDAQRSIPLLEFAPVAGVADVSVISLQQKQGLEQLIGAREQFTIHDLGDEVDTIQGPFMDTAAILKNLDL